MYHVASFYFNTYYCNLCLCKQLDLYKEGLIVAWLEIRHFNPMGGTQLTRHHMFLQRGVFTQNPSCASFASMGP